MTTVTVRPRDLPGIRKLALETLEGVRGVANDALWHRTFEWDWLTLPEARLLWVSPELTDLLDATARTIPLDVDFGTVTPPWETGFAVFPSRLWSIDAQGLEPEGGFYVDAILWGPVRINGVNEGVSIGSWLHASTPEGTLWTPVGRSDWVEGEQIGTLIPEHAEKIDTPKFMPSAIEDRRRLIALWALMADERITERSTRVERNKSRRRRNTGPIPDVTVIHLRRGVASGAELGDDAEAVAGARRYSHRWMVRAHWRHQAYGPGRKGRKLVLILPHMKGPDGAPLKERVWSLDR